MTDITSPKLFWIKGMLFLVLALGASAILILETASLRVAVLLVIAVWAFCRAYYFAFYVIEHYIDPSYRYAGLASALQHILRQRGKKG